VKLEVILRRGESGFVTAECPALPGCWSQGATREEALANIGEAALLALESRTALGMPLPSAGDAPAVELATVEVA
jgi:predicted RNase H-like HicB family nuclease